MHLLDVFNEDVLMKIFVFSLDGDARKWFWSLPAGTISYLREFHEIFHHYCKGLYSSELLLDNYCEEFECYVQNDKVDSSSSVMEKFYEEFEKGMDLDQIHKDPFLPSTRDEESNEHDVLPLDPDIFFPFCSAGLSASNEFVVQEINQQLKEGFVSLNVMKHNELFQGGQEQPSFIDIADFKQQ